jgi:hypothetical protein
MIKSCTAMLIVSPKDLTIDKADAMEQPMTLIFIVARAAVG